MHLIKWPLSVSVKTICLITKIGIDSVGCFLTNTYVATSVGVELRFCRKGFKKNETMDGLVHFNYL